MSHLDEVFEHHKAFVGFLTAGHQGVEHTIQSAIAMIDAGVHVLELGIPFSDPVGDGPVIQASSQMALDNKMTPLKSLEIAQKIYQKRPVPIILMTYYNPLLQAGPLFYKKAKSANVSGILVVDLPIEEAENHLQYMKKYHLDPIFIVSPSTSLKRLKQIAKHSQGFIYYACQKGTTGAQNSLPKDLKAQVCRIKQVTSKPVVVGFGISNKKDAQNILELADGFVVGSAIVQLIHDKMSIKQFKEAIKKLTPTRELL